MMSLEVSSMTSSDRVHRNVFPQCLSMLCLHHGRQSDRMWPLFLLPLIGSSSEKNYSQLFPCRGEVRLVLASCYVSEECHFLYVYLFMKS